ncbi:MAG: hypothetical protein HYU66_21755 [Armatimonadetes bacterium]|nr:hypothetical protein [Armatimonadota bacterium]
MAWTSITAPALVLCEGQADAEVVRELTKVYRLAGVTQVEHVGGQGAFAEAVGPALQATGREDLRALGIVRDAETGAAGSLQSAVHALRKHGLLAADEVLEPGRVAPRRDDRPALGVLVLPDGEASGAVESVVLASISESERMGCVRAYMACLADHGVELGETVERDKRTLGVWFWSYPIRKGKAVNLLDAPRLNTDGAYWNWSHSAFGSLRQFVNDLAAAAA